MVLEIFSLVSLRAYGNTTFLYKEQLRDCPINHEKKRCPIVMTYESASCPETAASLLRHSEDHV